MAETPDFDQMAERLLDSLGNLEVSTNWADALVATAFTLRKVWNDRGAEALTVGDSMRMSVAFVDQLKARESDGNLLVRVKQINRSPDGTVVLWLENAPEIPRALPCECGCGKVVAGGHLELAHPEDYREERG